MLAYYQAYTKPYGTIAIVGVEFPLILIDCLHPTFGTFPGALRKEAIEVWRYPLQVDRLITYTSPNLIKIEVFSNILGQ